MIFQNLGLNEKVFIDFYRFFYRLPEYKANKKTKQVTYKRPRMRMASDLAAALVAMSLSPNFRRKMISN